MPVKFSTSCLTSCLLDTHLLASPELLPARTIQDRYDIAWRCCNAPEYCNDEQPDAGRAPEEASPHGQLMVIFRVVVSLALLTQQHSPGYHWGAWQTLCGVGRLRHFFCFG